MRYVFAAIAFVVALAAVGFAYAELMAYQMIPIMKRHQWVKPLTGLIMLAIAAVAAILVFKWTGR